MLRLHTTHYGYVSPIYTQSSEQRPVHWAAYGTECELVSVAEAGPLGKVDSK